MPNSSLWIGNMRNLTGKKIQEHLMQQQSSILEDVGLRNVRYDLEIEKLDKWGEDRRNSLKVTLKDLDDQIKELKKQARQAPNMPDRLKCEKERRKLEAERDEAWHNYNHAAKVIEHQKDELIDRIEKRLQQNVIEKELFTIEWEIK